MKLGLSAFIAFSIILSLLSPAVFAQGQPVSELIRKYQNNTDFGSQTSAVTSLAHHNDPKGPLFLGRVFDQQKDLVIRIFIIEQLVDAGTDAAGEALLDCANDANEKVVAAYRNSLI